MKNLYRRRIIRLPPFLRPYYRWLVRRIWYWRFLISKNVHLKYLNLEFSGHCNMNCRYCGVHNRKEKGFMDKGVLVKVLDDINFNKRIRIKELPLHNFGETLMHPKLIEFLRLIKKYKDKNDDFPRVTTITNAKCLTKEKAMSILKTEALDEIRFSIDGGNKRDYQKIRMGSKWEDIIKNVNGFLDLKEKMGSKIKTGMITIVPDKFYFAPEFLKLASRMDTLQKRELHNWEGSIDFKLPKKAVPKGFCNMLLVNMVVLWNGKVSPCNVDQLGKGYLGDIKKQSIEEIYFGENRRDMIEKMRINLRQEIDLCRNCGF